MTLQTDVAFDGEHLRALHEVGKASRTRITPAQEGAPRLPQSRYSIAGN